MPDEVPSMLDGIVTATGCGAELADQAVACWTRLHSAQPPIPEPAKIALLLLFVKGFMGLDDEPDLLEPA